MAAEIDRRDETWKEVEPVCFSAVAVLAVEVIEYGFDGCLVRDSVTVDTMVEAILQRGDNFGRGGEIHVRDP